MPRISKQQIGDAITAFPFSPAHAPDSPDAFANLSDAMQAAIVAEVHRYYYVEGRSAGQTRAKFAGVSPAKDGDKLGLPGPLRRKLFRMHGFENAIAPSYPVYLDGEPRIGSAHARMHGTEARERAAEAAKQQAQADARVESKAMRDALRADGQTPKRSDKAMRAQYAAMQATAPADAEAAS